MLLIIGFSQIVLAVLFWYLELKPYIHATKDVFCIKNESLIDLILLPFKILYGMGKSLWHLPKMIPFVLDVLITLFCIANLGFGAGVLGGISGLFLSNCISILIWWKMKKKKRDSNYYFARI
jgi:hypothetical protein